MQDTLNCKAGLAGISRALERTGVDAGVAVSGTIETMGTLLAGQDIEAFYTSIANRDLFWLGLNCATGPDFMTDHLRTLSEISRFPVACVPNAGLPDEEGHYNETAEILMRKVERFVEAGWINLSADAAGRRRIISGRWSKWSRESGRANRRNLNVRWSRVSRRSAIDDSTRPVIVGERTNVLGSRKFKRLVGQGKIEEAAEIGRLQVRRGAHVLDVCVQDPDRNEKADMTAVPRNVGQEGQSPPDDRHHRRRGHRGSTEARAWEIDHQFDQPRGRRRTLPPRRPSRAPIWRGLVVGCIDEDKQQAQAITRDRKLQIAQRSHQILLENYGVDPEDIIFDLLVFPVGTGDRNYIGSAVETIEGIRMVKAALPNARRSSASRTSPSACPTPDAKC